MRATVIVATVVCGLIVSGCGSKDKQPTATPSFDTSASTAPSAEPGSGGTSPAPGSSAGGGGPAAPTYPKSAKDYAQALLQAFGKNDKTRLGQLASQAAVLQLQTQTGLDPNWTVYVSCGADGGAHTQCVFRNAHGDVASVRVENAKLGSPMAGTEALIDRTIYSTDPGQYASTFALAWVNGNTERMRRLSSSSVVSLFNGKTKALAYTTQAAKDGDFWNVKTVDGSVGGGGFSFTLRIANGSLGKANAIVGATAI
ncbi:MAG TPA: hypothetical protein VFC19_45250 [Candidatus Limnocylindrales bacterium]|nr:hypothetical protein [Candidatus Limnocylindrales bacterium]